MVKLNIKTYFSLILIMVSILTYININQSSSFVTIESASAMPMETSIQSEDLVIDISRNSTAIGPNSVIEFSVELTNSLSESLYDISANVTDISDGLNLIPDIEPLFEVSSLDPDTSADFQFVAKYLGNTSSSTVDVVLMIDASGSMQEEIDAVKAELNDLIANLTSSIPDLRMGVIVFGWMEYDEYPTVDPRNYVELTNDYESVKSLINSLNARGGIEPWGDALYLANSWNWREEAAKLIVLVGDEDCDPGIYVGTEMLESDPNGYYNGSDLLNIVTTLQSKEVIISTVICGGATELTVGQFEWIAEHTEGTSVYLPDLELEGISLPRIIEEWTLELGRELYLSFNLTAYWRDDGNNEFFNSKVESFWLDFAPPSVIISKTITPTGIDVFSLDFYITVEDISPIGSVTFFHDSHGTIKSEVLTPIVNTSIYFFTLQDLSGGLNVSYFVKSSDVLRNSAFTPIFWTIVEPKVDSFGEEVTFVVEINKTLFSNIKIEYGGLYHFILSGVSSLDQIEMQLNARATNNTVNPTQTKYMEISTSLDHKIFLFDLAADTYAITLNIPSLLANKSLSYVWLNLIQPSGTRFSGTMNDLIRVYGLEWSAANGTYLSFDNPPSSPLVLRAEVYNSEWELVSIFNVGGSHQINGTGTYYVLIWATLRQGDFIVQLTEETPFTTDDPYYTYTNPPNATGAGFTEAFAILFSTLITLSILTRKKRKNRE